MSPSLRGTCLRTAAMGILTSIKEAEILLVDDDERSLGLLTAILGREGYARVRTTTDPMRVEELVAAREPDLVVVDRRMPGRDGMAVIELLRAVFPESGFLPIVMLTGDQDAETLRGALSRGANDFIGKPFRPTEVLLRIRTLLQTRRLYLELEDQKRELERRVRERTRELQETQREILDRLARAAEYRDDATGQHARRVGELAGRIARELGLGEEEAALVRQAATLHDIGKIGVPDRVLLKPGRYTAEEFEAMKAHAPVGGDLVSGSRSRLLQLAEVVARTHHERWDGGGYNEALRGSEIPLAGRIVAVADVFDALTSDRPYKRAWPIPDAVAEIGRQRGAQFDPEVVDAFLRLMRAGDAAPGAQEC